MKRIYISFITTVTFTIVITLIPYFNRNTVDTVALGNRSTQLQVQDSTFSGFPETIN